MKLIKYSLLFLAVIAALILLFINRNLAGLAEWVYPGSELWAHFVLLAVEGLAFLWFWRGLFGRHEHMLLMNAATPEEKKRFAEEMSQRMAENPLIQEAGLSPGDPEYMQACLDVLKKRADVEIQQNAKRIFLATALSQNGRLDALIVFVSLCRLVWRVSSIYNQRPHPREVASLYWAVVTSTFLALTLEELDIATEVGIGFGESFQAMAPAGVTASIPFAGKALQTFTSATIDGTANCYLALRAGIITRNAFAYRAKEEEVPGRAAVFREAGAVLLQLSGGLAERLGRAVGENIAGLARLAQDKTVQAGMSVVGGAGKVGQGIGISAGKAASGAISAVQTTGTGLWKAGTYAGGTLGRAAGKSVDFTARAILLPFRWTGKRLFGRKNKGSEEAVEASSSSSETVNPVVQDSADRSGKGTGSNDNSSSVT